MPLAAAKSKLFNFIRDRNIEGMRVFLPNIRMFAKQNGIPPREMGIALQRLKRERKIAFRGKGGWIVVGLPMR